MLNLKKQLVAKIKAGTGLDCLYELLCTSSTPKPVITYLENLNKDYAVGDTLGYSNINFYIKIWCDDLKDAEKYSIKLDKVTKDMGLYRVAYYELIVDSLICCVFEYSGLAREYFE